MAGRLSVGKELDDMTECSICTEVFTDPRVLPCIHTFCLQCLLNYGKESARRGRMHCPMCRKMFTIPKGGLTGLQKNFFMDKLLHIRKLSVEEEAKRIPCELCSSDEASAGETVMQYPPSTYCVQCHQNYCEQCSQHHRKITACSSHILVDLGEEAQLDIDVESLVEAVADTDKGKFK